MELRLLGPLELVVGRQVLKIGGPRQRVVLSMLAINANRVTAVHELVEALWDEAPPSTARAQIQTCVSSLRKLISDAGSPGAIRTRPPGYLLEIAAADLDSETFLALVAAARSQAEEGLLAVSAATLKSALALWRGPALADVDSDLVRRRAALYEDQRLAVIEERVRLHLALGGHEEIIGELAELVARYPLRERLAGFRMLALYRSGRQAEALAFGRRFRAALVDELGIEPGHDLQNLEIAILNRDPALDLPSVGSGSPRRGPVADAPATPPTPAAPPVSEVRAPVGRHVVPKQLPASIADFTGRDEQVEEIKRVLAGDDGSPAALYAVPIVAISGRGGVGKSTLAIRAAHELGGVFPDGHLYGDLQNPEGEDPTGKLLTRFLHALGVSGPAVPEDVQERAELYRSVLADKKLLVVLDDVGNEEQVRPLLPGSPTCAVITTSRMRLSGLSGAHLVDIEVLDIDRAMDLLVRILGQRRVWAERDAAVELVHLCGGLPLALRIAGERLASRPHWHIGTLVRRLADDASRLDEFTYRGLGLRVNIDLTYRSLQPAAKRLFRLVALLRTPEIAEWVAAALLDTTLGESLEVLESLVDARMLDTVEYPGERIRYRMHNLIRIYAFERAMADESLAERDEAVGRVLGGWLALTEDAHRLEYGGDYTILHGGAPRWRPPSGARVMIVGRPMDWLDAERDSLLAAVRQAAAVGLDELCWDLALTLVTLFETRGYFDDWRETTQLGLDVTESAGNRVGHAAMKYSLGTLDMFQKRLAEAQACFSCALGTFQAEGNTHGAALVLRNAAYVDGLAGRVDLMLERYGQALELMRGVGDAMGEAQVLRSMATYWMDEGKVDVAQELLERSLAICRRVRCLRGEAQVLHRFAFLHLNMGLVEVVAQEFERVLEIVRDIGDRIGEVYARYGLGVAQSRAGRWDTAADTLRECVGLARGIGERLVEGQALHTLGEIGIARGERAVAGQWLTEAGQVFEELGSVLWQAKTSVLLALVHAGVGEGDQASSEVARARGMLAGIAAGEATRLLSYLNQLELEGPVDDHEVLRMLRQPTIGTSGESVVASGNQH